MTPPADEKIPLRADAARNRDLVLRTARESLAGGDLALQLNEIARRAGVGVGTVYRHFPTRQALLEALVEGRFLELLDAARHAETADDPRDGVERLTRAMATIGADRGFTEVLAATRDARPRTSLMKAELDSVTGRILHRAHLAGAARPGFGAEDIRRLVCGIVHAACIGPEDAGAQAERYLGVLLGGLLCSPDR